MFDSFDRKLKTIKKDISFFGYTDENIAIRSNNQLLRKWYVY
jgi:hypothetical protein